MMIKNDLLCWFICGSISTIAMITPALYLCLKRNNRIWITVNNEKHKYSSIIEELYQDYMKSNDNKFQLYDENLQFLNDKSVNIKNESNNTYIMYYRK